MKTVVHAIALVITMRSNIIVHVRVQTMVNDVNTPETVRKKNTQNLLSSFPIATLVRIKLERNRGVKNKNSVALI